MEINVDPSIPDVDTAGIFIGPDEDRFKAKLLYESYFIRIILPSCRARVAITMQTRTE